jgi:hypothetical protein
MIEEIFGESGIAEFEQIQVLVEGLGVGLYKMVFAISA